MSAAAPLIRIDSLVKQYTRDTQVLTVLNNLSLTVAEGDFMALMGPSGSGKTTLLNLIAGIDRPTSGRIFVGENEVSAMSEGALAKWRSANVGFIFQLYNLVPVLTAFENVELPLLLTNMNRVRRKKQAELALSVVSLTDRMDHYPRQLSGGQEQRVALARAIARDPKDLPGGAPTRALPRSSASPSRARSRPTRRFSWPTSRPATSTRRAARRSSSSWSASTRSSRRPSSW